MRAEVHFGKTLIRQWVYGGLERKEVMAAEQEDGHLLLQSKDIGGNREKKKKDM